jgi:hypothetical protein
LLTKGSTIINIQRYISITKPTQRNHEKRSFHRRSPCDRYGLFFSDNLNRNVMRKTLEEILSEPANVEEIIRTATAINNLIEDSKKAGVEWPELEVSTFNDTEDDANR